MVRSDTGSNILAVSAMHSENIAQNPLKSHLMSNSNHACSIECSPSDILARSITNSAQYTQLQCGRNPRSVLQNVYLFYF